MKETYAIQVKNATVRFNIASEKVDNLKEYFIKIVKRQLFFEEFFALKDINLTIKPGESWGIVGRNGSGKSTLLKLICGVLTPYKGVVMVNGDIAPLIELGAGFDPDMTAGENIFLNGALLGHSKKYMQEHYNEIVDFAELHKFLEMPIKNYSSGMRARLGFAVATAVKPNILIVDEVLSVGDFAFQRKCEKRMQDMLSGGTTLLFVSHSIEEVKRLCNKALWLHKGEEVMQGDAKMVCSEYEKG
jgi:lipopolysaccharide transport system ATP-binding protein